MLNYARIYSLFFFSDVTLRVDSFLACFLYFVIPCCERCIPKCLKFLHLNVRATAVCRILTLSSFKKIDCFHCLQTLENSTDVARHEGTATGRSIDRLPNVEKQAKQAWAQMWIHGHCWKTRVVDGIVVSDAAKGCIGSLAISKHWRTQISISCFYM